MWKLLAFIISRFRKEERKNSSSGTKKQSPKPAPKVDIEKLNIPRYPPFAAGLPAASVEDIIASQGKLIGDIRTTLGFDNEQFHQLLFPVIERYAAFVHLLPASESHHHRGAGGLFRHGLEVAFLAARSSENVIFTMDGSPRERRNNAPRWRLACCFSGMLHDVGKPLHDIAVTNKNGDEVWNPYVESLIDWANRSGTQDYFLRWRDKRHKRHENFSLLSIERIISPSIWQYLSKPGPQIIEAMLEAIGGINADQPVTRLTLKADHSSTARDLRNNRMDVDGFAYGVPVERYVFDAIRRLINSGKWAVNKPGSKVWVLNQGVFIIWKQISDMYDLLARDDIPGIPRDTDTLADILIERGYAVPRTVIEIKKDDEGKDEKEEVSYRYWEVSPDALQANGQNIKVLMLRFESAELIFTSEPPPPVSGFVTGIDKEVDNQGAQDEKLKQEQAELKKQLDDEECLEEENEVEIESSSGSISPKTSEASKVKPVSVTQSSKPEGLPSLESKESHTSTEKKEKLSLDNIGMDLGLEIFGDVVETATEATQKGLVSGETYVEQQTSNVVADKKTEQPPAQGKKKKSEAEDPRVNLVSMISSLSAQPSAGTFLEKILLPIVDKKRRLGIDVYVINDHELALLYPDAIRRIKKRHNDVVKQFMSSDFISCDPLNPNNPARTVNGQQLLFIRNDIAAAFIACLDSVTSQKSNSSVVVNLYSETDEEEILLDIESSHLKQSPLPKPAVKKGHGDTISVTPKQSGAKLSKPKEKPPEPNSLSDEKQKPINVVKKEPANPEGDEKEFVILELIEMIKNREGRWLTSPVLEKDGSLITSSKALAEIQKEKPKLTQFVLGAKIRSSQKLKSQVRINDDGQLIVKKIEDKQPEDE